ncbi:Flagellar motor switch protein FliG [hydrothermal vent metagenome]|uniref:Flagellar motor switch protein FliG n=1 Tax=hydrothermal vent metagenome TaxID=652676 RepID=A0A3B1A2X2_9ZZZZ
MADDSKSFSGVERSAILLMSLGENEAAEVLKHMSPKEVQKLGEAMTSLKNIEKEDVSGALSEFCDELGSQTSLGIGSEDYLKKVLVGALGEDKANNVIDRILLGRHSKGLEALKWMDPRAVAEVIRLEHPQIISIVLSYLDSDQAADVLSALPENTRADILMRIASLDGIQPNAIHELDDILEKQFSGNTDNVKSAGVGGLKTAANILNLMDSSIEGTIMDKVRDTDGELSESIEELMFVFENLVDVDDRGIQSLLREISSENLVFALKGADAGVKDKILKNMSKRAAEMLVDDLETKGPVKLSEVETAQKEILSIARRMSESGEISLGGGAGEEYV